MAILGWAQPPQPQRVHSQAAGRYARQARKGEHEIYGEVRAINDAKLTVEKRDGSMVTVDASPAQAKFRKAEPSIGHALLARGTYDGQGVLIANTILHAKPNPRMWYGDR